MMTDEYQAVKDLDALANRIGFVVSHSKFEYKSLALYPKGKAEELNDCLPCYARDAQFGYYGTVEGLTAFLNGWEKALDYMQHIGATDKKKIERREELYRQNRTMHRLAAEAKEEKK